MPRRERDSEREPELALGEERNPKGYSPRVASLLRELKRQLEREPEGNNHDEK